jgi:hypothetical protein
MQTKTALAPTVQFEAFQDTDDLSNWRVEGIDSKAGDVYIAVFAGPLAKQRATEYSVFKNNVRP